MGLGEFVGLTTTLSWVALLVVGIAMTRRARSGERSTIALLASLYLAVSSVVLVAIEQRTATYYWTSDLLESTLDGGLNFPIPSAVDLVLAFSFTHIGIAMTLAATSRLVGSWQRLPRALLCVLVPSIAECVVHLGTWLGMVQWILERPTPAPLALGVVALSFVVPCAIGGVAVFLASKLRPRAGHQAVAGRIVA